MKIQIATFIILFLVSTGLFAQTAKISIFAEEESVNFVLKEIEKKTSYLFVYNQFEVDVNRSVSISAIDKTVAEILTELFDHTGIIYATEGNSIMLMRKNKQSNHLIYGIIKNKKSYPIANAYILIKGKTEAAITNPKGEFWIQASIPEILQISCIGYDQKELEIKSDTLYIELNESSIELEEVVVTGYGKQKRIHLTGAVETISKERLANRATNNVGSSLQGLIPNMNVIHHSGMTTAIPSFNIRGETSINGGGPLIVVDGVPVSDEEFCSMNINDIESISILKDASSAAIYGARAAFGVILVTTRQGESGTPTIRINSSFNFKTLTHIPEIVQDPYIQASYKNIMGQPWYQFYNDEELMYAKKRSEDPSLPAVVMSTSNPEYWTYFGNTNWFNEVYNKFGFCTSHDFNISGANEKTSYYFGVKYYKEEGMVKINTDTYDRYNLRNKINFTPLKWLKIGNNTSLMYYSYKKPSCLTNNTLGNINKMSSLYVPVNPDGSWSAAGAQLLNRFNVGGETKESFLNAQTQFTLNISLIPNMWNIKGNLVAKLNSKKTDTWDSDQTVIWKEGPNLPEQQASASSALISNTKDLYTSIDIYTDFNFQSKNHSFMVLAGYSQEYNKNEYNSSNKTQLITEYAPSINLATGLTFLSNDINDWAIRSLIFRGNYSYMNRYLFEINARYDGSSRFPKHSRFGIFPSYSAAWILSQESFFNPIKDWINFMKLRVSYGSLGNQNISSYQYTENMYLGDIGMLINGERPLGIFPPDLISNTLTWEKVYTINGGLDFALFENKLNISADIYRRDTKDMLTKGRTLPNVLGTSEPKVNAANMKTIGWELSFNWRDKFEWLSAPFNYNIRFVLSDSRSFITRFDNPTNYLGDYYMGKEFGEIWGLQTEGFFTSQEDIDNHANQWEVTSSPGERPIEPGDLKYKDVNNDGKINKGDWTLNNSGDYRVIGNSSNRYCFGLDISLNWHNFDLRAFFQGVGKKDWYPDSQYFFGIYWAPWANVLTNNLDHWTPENPNGYFPRLKSYLANGNGDLSIPQTRYMQNAAYIRMKNLTVGYTIPLICSKRLKTEARIYFSGENLFEITQLCKNYDPEGLDSYLHPFQRVFSFGLNLTF